MPARQPASKQSPVGLKFLCVGGDLKLRKWQWMNRSRRRQQRRRLPLLLLLLWAASFNALAQHSALGGQFWAAANHFGC